MPANEMVFIRRCLFLEVIDMLNHGIWQLNLSGLYLQVVFVQRWSLKGGVNPLKPSNLSTFHSIPVHSTESRRPIMRVFVADYHVARKPYSCFMLFALWCRKKW